MDYSSGVYTNADFQAKNVGEFVASGKYLTEMYRG